MDIWIETKPWDPDGTRLPPLQITDPFNQLTALHIPQVLSQLSSMGDSQSGCQVVWSTLLVFNRIYKGPNGTSMVLPPVNLKWFLTTLKHFFFCLLVFRFLHWLTLVKAGCWGLRRAQVVSLVLKHSSYSVVDFHMQVPLRSRVQREYWFSQS